MADPLSIAASIIGIVTFAAQVGGTIKDFIDDYRGSDLELNAIAAEVNALCGVLQNLHGEYENAGEVEVSGHSRPASKLERILKSKKKASVDTQPLADAPLREVLGGLNGSMQQLDDVVKRSRERIAKGGLYKVHVRALWQRTAKGIEKIRNSLSGYKMTLMLLLQAKTLERSATAADIKAVVLAASQESRKWKNEIDAGEQRIREIRNYLDESVNTSSDSEEAQIGSANAVQAFPSFEAWLESFSVSTKEEEEDEQLVQNFKKSELVGDKKDLKDHDPQAAEAIPKKLTPSSQVHLIIADLKKPASDNLLIEQLLLPLNTEIREVLRILKDRGYSSVTGLQIKGLKNPAMIGPVASLRDPVLVSVDQGKSSYDISQGLSINEDENLLKFYNCYIMARRSPRSELDISCELGGITVKDRLVAEGNMIRLCCTLRIPEDGKVHDTPTAFGPFPHVDISKLPSANVPPLMKQKGGLMIPMLQREAMCITAASLPSAQRSTNCLFAVRIYTGGVNAISGKKPTEKQDGNQDYYVFPLQKRVDGFGGTGNENVKQFVAMPLGMGYSVESQLTEAELGGIQLEIAPRLKTCVEFKQLGADEVESTDGLILTKTPRELHLRSGHALRMTEDNNVIDQVPWDWNSMARDADDVDLDTWAYWTDAGCHSSWYFCAVCKDSCKVHAYSQKARPASLLDLLILADLEPSSALVVAPVPAISIVLEHRSESGTSQAKLISEILFRTTITVSPFEGAGIFECRIKHALAVWYESKPLGPKREWIICNEDWQAYRNTRPSKDDEFDIYYVSIHSIGIADGYIVQTLEKDQPRVPRFYGTDYPLKSKPKGWEMALACGGEIRQRIQKDPIPEYWNWDAKRLINIQILNTVAFESMTGLAAPPSPISLEEYAKAGIPSLSYYSESGGSTSGSFPIITSITEIDSALDIKYGVRHDRGGKPVGCIICEKNLCDSLIEPCGHTFCIACIRYRMHKAGHTICSLCSKPASKIIISSAPMEMPMARNPKLETEAVTPTEIPFEIQLPSFIKMAVLCKDASYSRDSHQRMLERLLCGYGTNFETQCRLAIAQILKDLNYPREQLPSYVQTVLNVAMNRAIGLGSDDMVDLLLSLPIDVNFKYSGTTLLERATQGEWTADFVDKKRRKEDVHWRTGWKWREYVAKRLIDEGCDWHLLKRPDCPASNAYQPPWLCKPETIKAVDSAIREGIVEYAREKEQRKGAETIEVYEIS